MNIVFDLGGVVVAWQPDELVAQTFTDLPDRQLARREFIGHTDWVALDRGDITIDEVVSRGALRTGLRESDLRALIRSVPASLVPDSTVLDLLERLRARGHRLYCLSNMPTASIEYLEQAYSFWHVFEAMVISSRVRRCKPEPEIYAHLLAAHALRPAETIFVDDTPPNLRTAELFAMRTIHFQSAAQCEAELTRLLRA